MKSSLPNLSIFISHPSELLTDHRSHGDGLLAYGYISRLAERGHQLHVAAPEVAISGVLPANITIHPINTRFKRAIPHRLEYMLRSRLLLNRLRRQHRFDLIHQLNPVVKGLSLAMLGTGLPVVLGLFYPEWPADADDATPHTGFFRRVQQGLRQFAKKQCLRWQQRFASALLIATPNAVESLYRPEQTKEKIFLLHTGVDANRFSPAGESSVSGGYANGPQHILFVANLWRRKGILTLLQAFEIVADRLPVSRLTVVGSGGIEAEVHARAAQMSCRSRIRFIKHISREALPAALRECTVYCLPSHGEPLSCGALEAMACGKPIVGTSAGGLGLLIQPAGGRKVPPRDAQALAEALFEVLSSPELQTRMGKFNRRLIEENYSWEPVIDQLESVYQTVLNRQQGVVNSPSASHHQWHAPTAKEPL